MEKHILWLSAGILNLSIIAKFSYLKTSHPFKYRHDLFLLIYFILEQILQKKFKKLQPCVESTSSSTCTQVKAGARAYLRGKPLNLPTARFFFFSFFFFFLSFFLFSFSLIDSYVIIHVLFLLLPLSIMAHSDCVHEAFTLRDATESFLISPQSKSQWLKRF